MNAQVKHVLFWTPRILAIFFAAFISLFAADVFTEDHGLWLTLGAFAMHLVPTALIVAILILSWKREWIGGTAFLLLGIIYLIWAFSHLQWVLFISGPLFITGILFLVGWLKRNDIRSK